MNMWDRVLNLDFQKGAVRIETFGGEFVGVIHPYALYGVCARSFIIYASKRAKATLRVDNRQTWDHLQDVSTNTIKYLNGSLY